MITLPDTMTRCLAHANKPREFLPCAKTCARAVQIGLDKRPNDNVMVNACAFDPRLPMFVPLDGFPPEDEV